MFRKPKFLGVTTVSEKGQVVIPSEARAELGLEPGSKLVVMSGLGHKGVMFLKPEFFDKMIGNLLESYEDLQKISKDIKGEK